MTISENIAKIFFEINLKEDISNELLDDIEKYLVEKDKVVYPLRVFARTANHLFCVIDIGLNEETEQKEYTSNVLYKLKEYGDVLDLHVA